MRILEFLLNINKNKLWEYCSNESQYKSIKKTRKTLKSYWISKREFLFFIIQNSSISFLLSSSWENRRSEVTNHFRDYYIQHQSIELEKFFLDFWEPSFTLLKWNRRLKNNKLSRLKKISQNIYELSNKYCDLLNKINSENIINTQLIEFYKELAKAFWQRPTDKTVAFSTKMFICGLRIVDNFEYPFPHEISIPIDSRLQKIYEIETGLDWNNFNKVFEFFQNLSISSWISPLDIDTLLWTYYYRKYIKVIL